MSERVYIVLVNWNGWRDTILCLESLLRLDHPNFTVVVCDNASGDGSLDQIKRWCEGDVVADGANPALAHLTSPAVGKPVAFTVLGRHTAEQGAGNASKVVLVQTGANLGFAGGNNVGFRYALARGDADYIWALNNDTVVPPSALEGLLKRVQEDGMIGICGSTVRFMDRPGIVQAYGGAVFSKLTASVTHVGMGSTFRQLDDREARAIEDRLAYPLGASMLVSRAFVEAVGLMQEDYFLFFEEFDWAERARQHGYRIGFAQSSTVFHRAGAVSGSGEESTFSLYVLNRSRLRFIWRFYSRFLVINYLALWVEVLKALLRMRWAKAKAISCALLGIRLFKIPEIARGKLCV